MEQWPGKSGSPQVALPTACISNLLLRAFPKAFGDVLRSAPPKRSVIHARLEIPEGEIRRGCKSSCGHLIMQQLAITTCSMHSNHLRRTLCMWSIFSALQYFWQTLLSLLSHNAAVAAWQPWATMLPKGQFMSAHKSFLKTIYWTINSSAELALLVFGSMGAVVAHGGEGLEDIARVPCRGRAKHCPRMDIQENVCSMWAAVLCIRAAAMGTDMQRAVVPCIQRVQSAN
jgi:hypothetical protein